MYRESILEGIRGFINTNKNDVWIQLEFKTKGRLYSLSLPWQIFDWLKVLIYNQNGREWVHCRQTATQKLKKLNDVLKPSIYVWRKHNILHLNIFTLNKHNIHRQGMFVPLSIIWSSLGGSPQFASNSGQTLEQIPNIHCIKLFVSLRNEYRDPKGQSLITTLWNNNKILLCHWFIVKIFKYLGT